MTTSFTTSIINFSSFCLIPQSIDIINKSLDATVCVQSSAYFFSLITYCYLSFPARPSQDHEITELQDFAVSRGFDGAIQLWDLPYWKRKQCTSLFGYGSCIQSLG